MAAYENDSEAYRWDFGIFDPFPNPPYYGSGADQETTLYANYCIREVDADTSRAAYEEHVLESVSTQNLFGPYAREYNLVTEDGWEGTDETGPSSLYSNPRGYTCRREFSPKISDEYYVVDGQVGRRLDQMHPIPHVPRINGDIPSFDEATSDHQRLLERLRLYDLFERKVQGDGNCQFRALSDQLYQTSEHHEFVRHQVVEQLKSHPEIYDGYVPMTYSDYLKKISQSGEWGDHVTLQAAADSYGVKIVVITSFKDTCYIEILPSIQKSKRGTIQTTDCSYIFYLDTAPLDRMTLRSLYITSFKRFRDDISVICAVIFLSFWAEVHYNSIYLEEQGKTSYSISLPLPATLNNMKTEDLPTADPKKKKRWWQLGNKH